MADIAPAAPIDGDHAADEDTNVVVLDDGKPAAPHDPDVVEIGEGEDDDTRLPEAAVVREDGAVLLPLAVPVTFRWKRKGEAKVREEVFAELVFHRITGADLRVVAQAERDMVDVTALARSARMELGKFMGIYDRLDGADAMNCGRVLGHFLGAGPKTGR